MNDHETAAISAYPRQIPWITKAASQQALPTSPTSIASTRATMPLFQRSQSEGLGGSFHVCFVAIPKACHATATETDSRSLRRCHLLHRSRSQGHYPLSTLALLLLIANGSTLNVFLLHRRMAIITRHAKHSLWRARSFRCLAALARARRRSSALREGASRSMAMALEPKGTVARYTIWENKRLEPWGHGRFCWIFFQKELAKLHKGHPKIHQDMNEHHPGMTHVYIINSLQYGYFTNSYVSHVFWPPTQSGLLSCSLWLEGKNTSRNVSTISLYGCFQKIGVRL